MTKTKKKAGVQALVNLQYRGQGRYFAGAEFGITPISAGSRVPINHVSTGGGRARSFGSVTGGGRAGSFESVTGGGGDRGGATRTTIISNSNNHPTTTTPNNNNAVLRALNRIQTSGNFPASLLGLSLNGGGSRKGSQGSLLSRGGSVQSKHQSSGAGVGGLFGEKDALSVHSRGGSVQSRGGVAAAVGISNKSKQGSIRSMQSNKNSIHSSFRSTIHALLSPASGQATTKKNHPIHTHLNKIRPSQRSSAVSNVHSTNASFFVSRANSFHNLPGGISSPTQIGIKSIYQYI